MRLAIISDIHGNAFALDAILDDIVQQRIEQTICLGDAIQGGAQPAETLARLRELNGPIVMGNADAFLLTGIASGAEVVTEKQRAIREWSLAQLSRADIAFIQSFQPTVEIALSGDKRLLAFHGSPHSFDDVILPETPEETFQKMLRGFESHVLCGGHTHLQQIRRLANSFFFNPGCVGLAYNRHQPEENFHLDAWAEYAILTREDETLALEFRRVPFDVNRLFQFIRASGRPFAHEAAAQYQTR